MDYAAERLGGKCGLQMDLEFWHMALAQPKGVPKLWQKCFYLVLPDRTGTHALFHYALSSARCQIQYHRNISNSEETWVSGFWPFDTISYLGRFLEEVPWNHWARLETLLHVGSARCIYLPSSVRYFFSQHGTNKTGVSGCGASWGLEISQPTSTRMNLNSIASTFCWRY